MIGVKHLEPLTVPLKGPLKDLSALELSEGFQGIGRVSDSSGFPAAMAVLVLANGVGAGAHGEGETVRGDGRCRAPFSTLPSTVAGVG